MLLQLDLDHDNDEEEPEEVDLQHVFDEAGDDRVEDVIWEAGEEAEVEAAAHAAELADMAYMAYMAEALQLPSLMSSAQESGTESVGETARLKVVSVQIQLVFNPKRCVLYSFLNCKGTSWGDTWFSLSGG